MGRRPEKKKHFGGNLILATPVGREGEGTPSKPKLKKDLRKFRLNGGGGRTGPGKAQREDKGCLSRKIKNETGEKTMRKRVDSREREGCLGGLFQWQQEGERNRPGRGFEYTAHWGDHPGVGTIRHRETTLEGEPLELCILRCRSV